MPRQDEVAHDDALFHHSVFIKNGSPHLTKHLTKRFFGNFRIITSGGKRLRKRGGSVFIIGEIDIHEPFEQGKRFCLFITAAIINDRDGESFFLSDLQRFLDMR